MSARLPIVAVGARTPVGLRAQTTAAAVRAGIAGLKDHPFMVDTNGYPVRAALDGKLDPKRLGSVRLLTLARSALQEALSGVRLGDGGPLRLDVLLAVPEARPGFTDANAEWIARELTPGLVSGRAVLGARGHAGGLEGLRLSVQRLREGEADLCAIVGVDSYFSTDTITWLSENRRLGGDENRDGFFPGEAAGCVLVANPYAMEALRLPALAFVSGAHSSSEPLIMKSRAEVLGHGLADAILGACASLRLPAEAVDDVYSDINGERYRTDEWGFAVLRTNHLLRSLQSHTPASSWADVGAASGTLNCVLAVRAWARNYAAGTRALVWGSSEGGLRAAAVLEQGLVKDEGVR